MSGFMASNYGVNFKRYSLFFLNPCVSKFSNQIAIDKSKFDFDIAACVI